MKRPGRGVLHGFAIAAVFASAAGGYAWYRETQHVRDTDNAYVNADIAIAAAAHTNFHAFINCLLFIRLAIVDGVRSTASLDRASSTTQC